MGLLNRSKRRALAAFSSSDSNLYADGKPSVISLYISEAPEGSTHPLRFLFFLSFFVVVSFFAAGDVVAWPLVYDGEGVVA